MRINAFLRAGLCAAVVCLTAACGPREEASAPLPVLRPVPAWKLKDVNGREVKSTDFKGRVVLVDFWATWCAPCIKEMPEYEAWQKKYADRGLVVLGFAIDDEPDVEVLKRFAATLKISYPLLLANAELAESFGDFQGFVPTSYLIDREGNIRHVKTGATDLVAYEKLVESLL